MWYINSIRIFVTDFQNDYKQIYARLHPLGGGTVYHTFGYEFVASKLSCWVVGDTDNAAIRALTRSGTSYELLSDQGDYGDFYVENVSMRRVNSICQTLRPDLADDAPVYQCEMVLHLDE